MISFDWLSMSEISDLISGASYRINSESLPALGVGGFTSSPALATVASQYASYLTGHPGSLATATASLVAEIDFLHSTLGSLADALRCQEENSAEAFDRTTRVTQGPAECRVFTMSTRNDVPVTDLGYIPPVAAAEAASQLKALTAMFVGDDSSILAASGHWMSTGARITAAVESLQRAAAILAATTRGSAFENATASIESTVARGTVIAANAVAMGRAMAELPPIRTAALTRLLSLEAEAEARTAAVAATAALDPAAAVAGKAAAEAATRADVTAFVTGFLQPALDTARPPVTNLGTEPVGHHGGGMLGTGTPESTNLSAMPTTVSAGVAADGHTATVMPYTRDVPQAGNPGTMTAGAHTGNLEPRGITPVNGNGTTGTPGGHLSPPTVSPQTTGQDGRSTVVPSGTRPTTPPAPLDRTTAPATTVNTATAGTRGTAGTTTTPVTPATGSPGGAGQYNPGVVPGQRGNSPSTTGTNNGMNRVTQPLLPRALAGAGHTAPVNGGTTTTPGNGSAPRNNPVGAGALSTARRPVSVTPGTAVSAPGTPTPGTPPHAAAGHGTAPAPGVPGAPGTSGNRQPGPAGGPGAVGTGTPVTGTRAGRQPSTSPFTATGRTSGRKGRNRKDPVRTYFLKQFLGRDTGTVKPVIR